MLLALGRPSEGGIETTLEAWITWEGLPVFGDDKLPARLSPEEFALANGNCIPRDKLYERFRKQGLLFSSLVPPGTVCVHNVVFHPGCQMMAGTSSKAALAWEKIA
jgi:hypothetical protein